MKVRDIQKSDIPSVVSIYNYYIENSVATFEESRLSDSEMEKRINQVHTDGGRWLIASNGSDITGYAYSGIWQRRSAYRNSVEVTVYVSKDHLSKGVGKALYSELFRDPSTRSKHAIVAGITLPNPASIALHESFGMKKVAHFSEVGFKFDKWLDVGYWQLVL